MTTKAKYQHLEKRPDKRSRELFARGTGIRDGEQYQIDNGGDLLMYYDAYERCKNILKKFEQRLRIYSTKKTDRS